MAFTRRLAPLAAGGGVIAAAIARSSFGEQSERKFTKEDVAARDGDDGRPLWVTYRGEVHDVSEFAKEHPGGNFIRMAAGGDVETFWKYWYYHFHSPKVADALRRTRIGSLASSEDDDEQAEDQYRSDPERDPQKHLQYLSKPFNSETRRSVLSSSFLTPTDALYVRNHAPVPPIADGAGHVVAFVDGEKEVASASLSELAARFPRATVTSILQCAGNRAADDAKATGPNGFHGSPFESLGCGMVGCVQWSGVRLADVLPAIFPQLRPPSADAAPASALASAGPDSADTASADTASADTASADTARVAADAHVPANLHVIFEGADGYESSTPARAVLREGGDCLLATHMNGERLAADHGFPCRALLPGIAGARSVKWVSAIRLSEAPSSAPWNASYYRRADGSEVQALPPLQSIILQPTQDETVAPSADGTLTVQGVAYPGAGGGPIEAVEVSADGGVSWHAARLLREEVLPDDAKTPHHWLRWVARVPLASAEQRRTERCTECRCTLSCRAFDANGHTQPKVSPKQRGYLYNGWFHVDLTVAADEPASKWE